MLECVPQLEIDWEDFDSIRILADAEEETGNYHIANILRWMAHNKLSPKHVTTCTYYEEEGGTTPTYDWNRLEHYTAYPHSAILPNKIFNSLPISVWVNYEAYNSTRCVRVIGHYLENNNWRYFISVFEAYRSLIETCEYLISTNQISIEYPETFVIPMVVEIQTNK